MVYAIKALLLNVVSLSEKCWRAIEGRVWKCGVP